MKNNTDSLDKRIKKSYYEGLEKYLTAIFGIIGTIAIIINLHLKGYESENILDAIKDIAGLIAVFTVFLLAYKHFGKEKFDFNKEFENDLKEWIKQNDYLVCENFDEDGKGKHKKRCCSMMIDHSNILTRKKYAKDAITNKEKGAFVYLPYFDDDGNLRNEFEFRFNERTFENQKHYRDENGKVNLKEIIEQIKIRIEDNFKSIGIKTKANPSNKTITVSYEDIEINKDSARKLIDIIEFVKTLVLAIA